MSSGSGHMFYIYPRYPLHTISNIIITIIFTILIINFTKIIIKE